MATDIHISWNITLMIISYLKNLNEKKEQILKDLDIIYHYNQFLIFLLLLVYMIFLEIKKYQKVGELAELCNY